MIIFFNRRKQESCDKKKLDSLHPSISRLIKFKAFKNVSFAEKERSDVI
jgi:hypothetical protein